MSQTTDFMQEHRQKVLQQLAAARSAGNREEEAASLYMLAMFSRGEKNDEVLTHYREALQIYVELGQAEGQVLCLAALAVTLAGRGHRDEALLALQQARTVAGGNPQLETRVLHSEASMLEELKDFAAAQTILERLVANSAEPSDKVQALLSLSQLLEEQGKSDESMRMLEQARSVAQDAGDQDVLTRVDLHFRMRALRSGAALAGLANAPKLGVLVLLAVFMALLVVFFGAASQ